MHHWHWATSDIRRLLHYEIRLNSFLGYYGSTLGVQALPLDLSSSIHHISVLRIHLQKILVRNYSFLLTLDLLLERWELERCKMVLYLGSCLTLAHF